MKQLGKRNGYSCWSTYSLGQGNMKGVLHFPLIFQALRFFSLIAIDLCNLSLSYLGRCDWLLSLGVVQSVDRRKLCRHT